MSPVSIRATIPDRGPSPLDFPVSRTYHFPISQTLQYLTDEHGERTAVVLPMTDYEKLLEDLDDLAAVAERRDELVIPHSKFVDDQHHYLVETLRQFGSTSM